MTQTAIKLRPGKLRSWTHLLFLALFVYPSVVGGRLPLRKSLKQLLGDCHLELCMKLLALPCVRTTKTYGVLILL